jgi:hypothetical protein
MKLLEWRGLRFDGCISDDTGVVSATCFGVTYTVWRHPNRMSWQWTATKHNAFSPKPQRCESYEDGMAACNAYAFERLLSSGVVTEVEKVNSETTKPSEV